MKRTASRRWRATIASAAVVVTSLVVPAGRASADVTFNQRMLQLVNEARSANGLAPVTANPTLGAVAEDSPYSGCGYTVLGRATDLGQRNYFSHTIRECGTQSVFNMLDATNLAYGSAGENLAWMSGTTDPVVAAENLHNQLMNSPGHRANILTPQFTKVGIGSWRTSPGQTWSGDGSARSNVFIGVQVFASDMGYASPVPGARYHSLTPSRILDTRYGNGAPVAPLGPGATMNLQVTGRGGVPATGVSAVVVNVTVTQPTAPSFLTVFPAGEALPLAANLNYGPGQTVPNLVTAKLGANGQVSIYNAAGSTHVVADVAGWFDTGSNATGARYHPVTPSRILDTRYGNGAPVAPLGPGATMNLQVTGRGGVPATGVSAVVVNVTVTEPTAPSFLTVFPAGESLPLAANLNYGPTQTVPNLVTAKLGANGQVSIYNAAGSTHVVADVAGWFDTGSNATGARYHPLTPSRILDTRYGNGAPVAPLGPGATMNLQVTERGGLPPAGVSAVVVNVTVTEPTAPSFLTVFPAGESLPLAANLNYGPGQTVPNLVIAKLGANGQVSIYNAAGSTHVVADVAGYYDNG